jgi:hypothetical protein
MWIVTFLLRSRTREKMFYDLAQLGAFLVRFAKVPTFELRRVRQVLL